MLKINPKFFFFILLIGLAFKGNAQVLSQKLNANWSFQEQDNAKWYPAKVPGEVHVDLMANKLIPDPFYRDNEKKVQWIEKENWDYKSTFSVLPTVFKKQRIELIFDGLDTYADVYLNGKLILQANNMFRQWKIDVKKLVRLKDNKLLIRFRSAQNTVDSLSKADLPYFIPDNPRAYVRKAQFHFGWDWGPKLTGCGIWKEVRLEGYDHKLLEKPFVAPINVELVQQPDDKGTSFYFKIDGKPVYMKGANYIPSDAFVTRMTKNDYRKMLLMAKDANMNMLRVWGGGIYESDDFYDLCDSLGIHVWQDFMFAGAMVPGNKAFFDNVREEVKYQVKRLRHHKSIVLWCGNNEVDEAFNRWGWQNQFRIPPKDSAKLWNDYIRLFRDSIPKWIKEVDGSRPYISSSPKYGWGVKNSFTEGDSHYWGVWWGNEDFEVFEKKTGRFVSEYGMQAMPNYSSILKFTQPQDRYLFSEILKDHQKAGNGFAKLNVYLKNYMIDSAKISRLSVEDYTYLTQCVQYYGFKNMILIHQSKAPYNMGSLLWQLNDCWPVASWSITDYYNRTPKAAWYAVKEAYRDDAKPGDVVKPKDLKLSNPKITYQIKGNQIILKSSSFAKYVFVDIVGYAGKLSDNYFDLLAGKEKIVTFDKKDLKAKEIEVKVKSLWDVVNK
ncbi:beta-mannosidase [Pedobacter boryungensis]|uniref:beta-mannosidase n=1 Tax=Pedobacter boryungensis TaxID=869962 RepID=A0ABX2DAD9_9SPHI|nr:glycoside hydrolase family 2 protein [Pedobacter boryungensis]NQX30987.1 glycoside hydrolase family 2 protein [Pedobacter boryungensis]